jgi:hypothetical protein
MMKKAKKIRSYSDYTLEHLRNLCGIDNHNTKLSLLKHAIKPSDWLLTTIRNNQIIPINSEKARSELLITPVFTTLKVITYKK